jgi:ABC-type phosphate/phosphonate transport system substrate-binding protein
VVEAVMSGAVDAGATYSDVLLDHQQEGVLDLHIVAKGALVPHDAYVIRAGLPPIVSKAIAMAMAEISTRDDEGRKILAPLRPINGFITVDDSHYERVRAVDAQVEAAMGSEW